MASEVAVQMESATHVGNARRYFTLVLLIMTSTLSTLSDNLFLPSLPHLPEYFHTTREMVKYTVSLSMLAYGSGLLFFGPLSDRFGRKPVLVTAMAIFTVVSFGCTIATSIGQLIAARIFQGIASGAEGVLVMSILVDLFDTKGQVRANSLYRAACAIPPIFAPILGSYVYMYYGWQANFYLLAVIALIVTVCLQVFLRESRSDGRLREPFKAVLLNYGRLAGERTFLCLAVIMGAGIGFLVIFHATTPFVLFEVLHEKTQVFGYFQACMMLTLISSYGVTGVLVRRMPTTRVVLGALLVALAGNLMLIAAASWGELTLLSFGIPVMVIAFGSAPLLPAIPALVMKATEVPTGQAAAMLLTITSILASTTAVIEGRISDGSVWSFVIVLTAWPILALLAYWVGVRGRVFADA